MNLLDIKEFQISVLFQSSNEGIENVSALTWIVVRPVYSHSRHTKRKYHALWLMKLLDIKEFKFLSSQSYLNQVTKE